MFRTSAPLAVLVGVGAGCGTGVCVPGVVEAEDEGFGVVDSVVMVDWEEEREKVLARGAR